MAVLAHLPRRTAPGGVRIVHYHYVFDDERESFARQLEYLLHEFELVSLTDAVERLETRVVGGRELVVTFDDGFRNQLRAGRLLAERGVSACFFLITELVSADARRAAEICRERLHLPRPVEPLQWDDASELLNLGHEVGSHTRQHTSLVELEPAALEEELRSSREDLQRRLGRSVHHLSAPYADRARFSARVSHAARAAGYASCSSAIRGRNHPGDSVFSLRRHHLEASWPVRDLRYFLGRR